MSNVPNIIWGVLLLLIIGLNLYSFSLFYQDKQLAQQQRFRVSENKLLWSSLLFGGIGAYLAMRFIRHKTRHTKFRVLVPISAGYTLVAMVYLTMQFAV